MPDGGRIRIVLSNERLDETQAERQALPPGDYVRLSVGDTGSGMSDEVLDRAFDPFFTTKPIGQGTGLGLSMVHGFVLQSGGEIRIDSAPGAGTWVHLYLPRQRLAPVASAPIYPELEPSRPGRGETILVVDDEPTIRTCWWMPCSPRATRCWRQPMPPPPWHWSRLLPLWICW